MAGVEVNGEDPDPPVLYSPGSEDIPPPPPLVVMDAPFDIGMLLPPVIELVAVGGAV